MLTPTDIENKMFKKVKIGGYSIKEVEDFLEIIINDYETVCKENARLKEKCCGMEESIAYYRSLEEAINQTVDNVNEEAEKIIGDAIVEVEYIKKNQEAIVNEKISDINRELAEKEVRFENLKKQMDLYRIKTLSMVEAQMKILKATEEETN